MSDTPISDAVVSNSEPHGYQVVPYHVAQNLERENRALRERTIRECAALFSEGARNRELYVNDIEERILSLLEDDGEAYIWDGEKFLRYDCRTGVLTGVSTDGLHWHTAHSF